jgi:hypothetical protein
MLGRQPQIKIKAKKEDNQIRISEKVHRTYEGYQFHTGIKYFQIRFDGR